MMTIKSNNMYSTYSIAVLGAAILAACSASSNGSSETPSTSTLSTAKTNVCALPIDEPAIHADDGYDGTTAVANNVDAAQQCVPHDNGRANASALGDDRGHWATLSSTAKTDGCIKVFGTPFATSYGTNDRSCHDCHRDIDGWTITAKSMATRFEVNDREPIFAAVDGATSPHADVSTHEARRTAFALLIARGAFRVGMAMPKDAEFDLESVDDPYGFASAAELSLFRRPLPTANLKFESDIMWDGRESADCTTIGVDLASQAVDATKGHAEGTIPLPSNAQKSIVAFERYLYMAQIDDLAAGALNAEGAKGGVLSLASADFYYGMNDSRGQDPTSKPFNPNAFTLFEAWTSSSDDARRSIARGEALFNARTFTVRGVRGLNDELGNDAIGATCTTCHDTPNVGTSSSAHRYDIGIADGARRTSDIPLYTLHHHGSDERIQTTDPGRALVTGRWSDVDRFKVPGLRGVGVRAPYFHDGSAPTLEAAIDIIDARFSIGFSNDEKKDVVAFLQAL